MLTEFTKQKKLFVFSTPLFFITILILLSSIINAQNQRAIDGEMATCKITFNGKVFEPKLNQIGYFDRVLHIPALTKISVEVYYPDGNINDKIVLFVEDGGKLDSDKATETVQLNNQKRLSFNFETVAQPGLFRVVLKKGNDTKVVQFWSDKKNTSINAPTYDDDEYCGNDKQEGTDGGDDDEDDDDCIPCKQKDSSNTPEPGDAFVPFTGNESRNVQDLEIWGGPGEIPLKWTRYGNSRGGDFKHRIGTAYFWNYSFNYTMLDEGPNDQGHDQVSIHYPQGGKNTFTQDTINPNVWLPEAGIDKILFEDGNNFFLQFANGHRYRFEKLTDTSRGIYYQLQDFRDIFQNLYTLTYENRLLKKVTEPAGRYFEIYYDSVIGVPMISKVSTNDGRSVLYNYDIYNDTISAENVIKWIRLINVSYGDGTQAVYTYSQREHGSMPVLEHAIDPRYTGMDVNMIYIYDTSMNIAGFIKEERNGATGEIMTTLTPGVPDKIVCYANGRVQTFKEPTGQQGYLNTYNDGLGRSTKYVYDDAGIGFLKSKTDALGRTTIYNKKTIYGNPLKITYPDGSIEKWTRDSLDLVLTHTDELGRATTYTRDNNHRVKRIDYPDNSYEIFTYNNFGEVLEHKRRNGGIERTVYDSRGLRRTFRDAEGNLTKYGYDDADRLASVTDALGHVTRYEYDERGLLTKMTNADGSLKTYTYDEFGNRTTTTDELGHTWTTLYDEFKRPVKRTDPLHRITKYDYDLPGGVCGCTHDNNKPTKIILPSRKITKITYDVEWQKISETVGAGTLEAATTFYEYDLAGNLVSVVDPRLKEWKMEYDKRNRKIASEDPLQHKTEWAYDSVGNVVKITRPDLGFTQNFYDAMNRDTMTVDPKKQVTKMQYDDEDNLIALTDPNSHSYQFKYDLLNRKTKMIYPDASFEKYTYDAVSNLKTYTNRSGAIRTYNYDNRNREIFSFWNDGLTPSIFRNYDVAGKLTDMSSSISILSYQYDEANELTKETQTIAGYKSGVIKYEYNLDGLRNKMIYPGGTVLHYHYTKRNQLSSVLEDTAQVVAYTYDFNGNRINKTLENGTNTHYTYDDANRMLSVDNLKGSTSFARFDYGYDNVDRRTYEQRDNDKGDVYKYDAIDQVTDVLYNVTDPAGTASNPLRTVNYDWDSLGNRKTVTDNAVVTNYTTNKLNEYTKIDDDKLAYNEKGDLKTYNGWTYKYDAQDRLINATNSGTTVDFVYDARNRCIKRTINGTSIFFYYDDWNLIEERNANKTEIAHYINATYVDEILKKVTPSETVYYHHDALGSVTHLTDATGKVVEKYSYDVFGAPTIRNSNRDSLANSALGNRFMFTDREYIKELGLYDYRNRMYSDTLGRFLQTDPLRFNAGDVNLYRYVGNKVVNLVDPIGLIPVTVTVIGTCTPKNATEKCLSDSASASVTGESGNYKIITDAIKALHVEARIAAAALCGVCCQFNEIGADVEYDKNEKPKK